MMKFNPKARIDRSQIDDRRGQRSGGSPRSAGFGGGMPRGLPIGGGIGGIVVFIIIAIVAAQFGFGGGSDVSSSGQEADSAQCETGADADQQDCRVALVVTSIQAYWASDLPSEAGIEYERARWAPFDGSTDSGCGQATEAMGPFYCPVDTEVYVDLTFFEEMLEGQLGASGGDFAEAYVMAHEYGHHVQDLQGTLAKYESRETGPTSPSVRIELQADCYAGMWAHNATTVTDENGEVFITELTDDDIAEAIDAATAVGDDRIQQQSSGGVNEEQWTHGSAAERVRWFTSGFQSGSMDSCDTFAADAL